MNASEETADVDQQDDEQPDAGQQDVDRQDSGQQPDVEQQDTGQQPAVEQQDVEQPNLEQHGVSELREMQQQSEHLDDTMEDARNAVQAAHNANSMGSADAQGYDAAEEGPQAAG